MVRAATIAVLLLSAHGAWGQYVVSARAGTIHFVRGQVSVDGQPVHWSPTRFTELKEGQVLRTGNGRAEVLLGPGVFLRLGERGALRMLNTHLEDTQAEVQQGTALVEVVDMPRGSDVHVVVGPTLTGFRGIGLHRFQADTQELRVFGGHADVFEGNQRIDAGRGRVVHLGPTLSVDRFDPNKKDDLLQWAARRSYRIFNGNQSGRSRQTNWEVRVIAAGERIGVSSDRDVAVVSNRDFGVMFQSRGLGRSFPRLEPPVLMTPGSDGSTPSSVSDQLAGKPPEPPPAFPGVPR
jgi:hypothetical protein